MAFSAVLTDVRQMVDTVRVVYEIRTDHQVQLGTDGNGDPVMGLGVYERFVDFLRPSAPSLNAFLAVASGQVLEKAKAEVDAANLVYTNLTAIRNALIGGHYP